MRFYCYPILIQLRDDVSRATNNSNVHTATLGGLVNDSRRTPTGLELYVIQDGSGGFEQH
jgi:hypothetical protein